MIIQRIIGAISHGVEGQDLYIMLEENDGGCITDASAQEFFSDNYYAVSSKEAGGFFCYQHRWLQIDADNGVLVAYQRYDV